MVRNILIHVIILAVLGAWSACEVGGYSDDWMDEQLEKIRQEDLRLFQDNEDTIESKAQEAALRARYPPNNGLKMKGMVMRRTVIMKSFRKKKGKKDEEVY